MNGETASATGPARGDRRQEGETARPGRRWLGAALDQVGVLGVAVTTITSLGCCAPAAIAPVAAFLSSLGLWFLVDLRVSVPILYGAVGLILLGLLLSYRRHRRPYGIALGLLGSGAVLYPFHAALEVWLFITLVFGGQALLLSASILEIVLARRRPALVR